MMLDGLFNASYARQGTASPTHFPPNVSHAPRATSVDNYGSKECSACGVSEYQPSQGQTACIPCHASRTTSVQGASSLADCICPGGTIEDSNAKCVECSIGLTCPVGSTLQKLKDRNLSSSAQSDYPTVDGGFRANPESPLDMYKCAEPFACPGGGPGQCLDARVGLTCGDCPAGQYWGSGACQECGVGVPVALGSLIGRNLCWACGHVLFAHVTVYGKSKYLDVHYWGVGDVTWHHAESGCLEHCGCAMACRLGRHLVFCYRLHL